MADAAHDERSTLSRVDTCHDPIKLFFFSFSSCVPGTDRYNSPNSHLRSEGFTSLQAHLASNIYSQSRTTLRCEHGARCFIYGWTERNHTRKKSPERAPCLLDLFQLRDRHSSKRGQSTDACPAFIRCYEEVTSSRMGGFTTAGRGNGQQRRRCSQGAEKRMYLRKRHSRRWLLDRNLPRQHLSVRPLRRFSIA